VDICLNIDHYFHNSINRFCGLVLYMVFYTTFNNISVILLRSVLLVEETGVLKDEFIRGRRRRDRMVVGFTTTYAISAYHHQSCEFELRSWRDVLDTILCDKFVMQ
jgi:hypothetical protein